MRKMVAAQPFAGAMDSVLCGLSIAPNEETHL